MTEPCFADLRNGDSFEQNSRHFCLGEGEASSSIAGSAFISAIAAIAISSRTLKECTIAAVTELLVTAISQTLTAEWMSALASVDVVASPPPTAKRKDAEISSCLRGT